MWRNSGEMWRTMQKKKLFFFLAYFCYMIFFIINTAMHQLDCKCISIQYIWRNSAKMCWIVQKINFCVHIFALLALFGHLFAIWHWFFVVVMHIIMHQHDCKCISIQYIWRNSAEMCRIMQQNLFFCVCIFCTFCMF